MTKEDKQLLLKDLCARLPYGVMFDYNNNEPLKVEGIVRDIVYFKGYNYQTEGDDCYANITECKPYLRHMSSMTKEERLAYEQRLHDVGRSIDVIDADDVVSHTDWLLSHHFDFRGLISMGLALEAPNDMYKNV